MMASDNLSRKRKTIKLLKRRMSDEFLKEKWEGGGGRKKQEKEKKRIMKFMNFVNFLSVKKKLYFKNNFEALCFEKFLIFVKFLIPEIQGMC